MIDVLDALKHRLDPYDVVDRYLGKRCETPEESIFLTGLLDGGIIYELDRFVIQERFYKAKKYVYRADFIIGYKDKKFVVEIDGHHHNWHWKQIEKDEQRDADFNDAGYSVIRIPNKLLRERPQEAIEFLKECLGLKDSE